MREFSKVAPNVWRSRKFWQLPDDDARLVYFYLLTNPHGNSAGCFDLNEGYGSADMRWTVERYRKAIESLRIVELIDADDAENTLLIENWVTFNEPTNAKHAFGILTQLSQASSERLKGKRALEYQRVIADRGFLNDKTMGKAFASFFEHYGKAISTRDRDQRPETRPRQDQTETKTETRENSRPPDVACALKGAAPPSAGEEPDLSIPPFLDRRVKPEPPTTSRLLETDLMKRTA